MTILKKLSINTENKSIKYSILIGDNFIESLENNFFKTLTRKKIYVIYDEFFYKVKSHKKLVENFENLSKNYYQEVFFSRLSQKINSKILKDYLFY